MEHFKRITSAFVILPPLLLFLYYAPKELFLVFVLALVALSLREYVHMLALVQMPVCPKMSFIVAVTLVCVAYFGGESRLSLGTIFEYYAPDAERYVSGTVWHAAIFCLVA